MKTTLSIPLRPLSAADVQNRRAFLKREIARSRHDILAQAVNRAELRLLDREAVKPSNSLARLFNFASGIRRFCIRLVFPKLAKREPGNCTSATDAHEWCI
jgi:hypothetical protein